MLGVCKKFAGSFGLPWWTYKCSIAFPRNHFIASCAWLKAVIALPFLYIYN